MRIKHVINVRIFEDADAKDGLWTPDKVLSEEVIDNMQRMTSGRFNIPMTPLVAGVAAPDGTETETLSVGDIGTARCVYIEADGDFQVVFNAAVGVWTPQATSAVGWPIYVRLADTNLGRKSRYFAEQDVTAIQVSNPSTTAVLNGRYVVYGDPLA